jgi:hypothetical protein
LFGQIYGVEQEARQADLAADQRLALRQQKSVSLMAALKERVVALRQQMVPGSTLAKACDYTLNQWSRLEVFLQDGRLEADNNLVYAARGITALCRLQYYAAWQHRTLKFLRKPQDSMIADAA